MRKIHQRMLIAVIILLLIATSRFSVLPFREFNYDEVWNVFQTSGSFSQALLWIPFDWTPLHFILLWVWQSLVGSNPFALRVFAVLPTLLASAFIFRSSYRIFGQERGAWASILIFTAFSFNIYLSTQLRAYSFLIFLTPLNLWLLIRFFDKRNLKRGIALSIGLALLFYTSLSVIWILLLLIAYAFIVYRQDALYGIFPGLGALVLILPELVNKFRTLNRVVRNNATPKDVPLGTLFESFIQIFRDFTGTYALYWLIGSIILSVFLLIRIRSWTRAVVAFIVWSFGFAVLVWFMRPYINFFTPQFSWWIMLGLAFLFGYALTLTPKPLSNGIIALLIVALFIPYPVRNREGFNLPFEANLHILAEEWRTGDVLLIDENCDCGSPMEWRYYQSVYFPNGLEIVDSATDHERIWYLATDGRQDPDTFSAVLENRLGMKFFGTWNFLFRLYEAPPDVEGILFDNGMRFHGVRATDSLGRPIIEPLVYREGETVTLRLWWSADEPIEQDYSVGLHIRNTSELLAQSDSSPQIILHDNPPFGTSGWSPDYPFYYIEERQISLPSQGLKQSSYNLGLTVYQSWDGVYIDAINIDENGFMPLFDIHIMAW